MNKYTAVVLYLLVFASSVHAVDSFDDATGVLIIPSVIVGPVTYKDVTVRLDNFTVLDYDQNPSNGIDLNTDSRIGINLGNTSRGIPSLNDGRVSFSVKVTNKTSARMYISAAASPNLSTLSDNKGNVCDNYNDPFNGFDDKSGGYLYISGVSYVGRNLFDKDDINNYTVIEPGKTKILGVSSFNPAPVDSSACYFTGDIFTFQSYLWLYNEATSSPELISYSYNDVVILANDTPTIVAPPVVCPIVTPLPIVAPPVCVTPPTSPTNYWN